jgi:Fe2+ transport system protein FeoA
MVMLNELDNDQFARIVDIRCKQDTRQKLYYHGISEGSFVRIVYSHGCINVNINSKLFNISMNLAEKIRVITIRGE